MPGNEPSSLSALLTAGPTEVLCPQCNAGLLHITMKAGAPALMCPTCDDRDHAEQPDPAPKAPREQ
jgi:hypothetical protein